MMQEKAFQLAMQGHNIFLTGNAGTGKTYILNKIIKELRKREKIVAVTASTGLASTHIGGQTIHSWASIGIKSKLDEEHLWKIRNNKFSYKRIYDADVVVIDEISMLHDYRLDMVDEVCRFVCESRKPFGGKQVILVGDFFQLPPVERDSISKHYCFRSESWKTADLKTCYLKKIYRQTDEKFIDLLNGIRAGKVTKDHKSLLSSLRENTGNRNIAVNLFCKNENVEILNSVELSKIKTDIFISRMESSGLDFKVDQLKKNVLAPETLLLKIGAKVMILVNDLNQFQRYVNGTMGEIIGLPNDNDCGDDDDNDYIKIKEFKTGSIIRIEKYTWKMEEYSPIHLKDIEVATITQYPIRLAWAITIHKSQGATFDFVNLDLGDAFSENMGYVALSRVTSLGGLYLDDYNDKSLKIDLSIIKKDLEFQEESEKIESC